MKTRLSFLLLSMMALLLVVILTAFTNTPHIAQDSVQQTETAIYARATEIVRGATLTAQVGGDMTQFSGGTSTPLAGMCNAMTYRNLNDVEVSVKASLISIADMPQDVTVEALLLEETIDCINFTRQELTVSISVLLPTLDDLNDENRLGVRLGRVLSTLFSSTTTDTLSPVIEITFEYGNQSRTFSAEWRDVRAIGASGLQGAEVITLFSLAGVEDE